MTSSQIDSSSHISQYFSHLSPRSSSSISSLPDSTIATPTRFSVNSNLMNYSIPKNNNNNNNNESEITYYQNKMTTDRRTIQEGSSDTRTRQLEAQIEALTLSNVKLQRANRLLKVDTDNLIEQKTQPLNATIRELTFNNVQLQRTTRLLQQDLEDKNAKLNQFQSDQVLSMKTVGPEYEYLVQMINLLHRQINGDANCEEVCCYTSAPVDQSTVVMTLPPENEEKQQHEDGDDDEQAGMEAQHICRPVIHSSISQGSYAAELERKLSQLEQIIDELETEKETLLRQQSYKDDDIQMLKKELQIKDEIVSQLEQDFMELEEKLTMLQKELDHRSMHHHHSPSPPPDPKRQSQMLMESKRRSLAIKDTDLLEKMLRGDLDMEVESNNRNDAIPPSPTASSASSVRQQHDEDDDIEVDRYDENQKRQEEKDDICENDKNEDNNHQQSSSSSSSSRRITSFLSTTSIPCGYPSSSSSSLSLSNASEMMLASSPAPALFTMMSIFLGCAAQIGITDDWTLPITLTAVVSGFLWSGGAKGVQLKVKLN
ncbi:uncharacterized protein BX664DRAFT_280669 [Halteromyces radiatus]|uniref:uncharacterized protein n=1 Tax=Halteromyces radiatus TaxID=101107 RepID=UPI002220E70B|nr:uncharacterized protein BX664DRAFT_280669 [Halteromyces radiatus]KAI8089596.1 hypothetical protein BX664DRAFT_280669 [Halteromyces radiatus]